MTKVKKDRYQRPVSVSSGNLPLGGFPVGLFKARKGTLFLQLENLDEAGRAPLPWGGRNDPGWPIPGPSLCVLPGTHPPTHRPVSPPPEKASST